MALYALFPFCSRLDGVMWKDGGRAGAKKLRALDLVSGESIPVTAAGGRWTFPVVLKPSK